MKKIIAFIMAALLLLTACNNSQGNLPKEYVGKWQANVVASLFDGVKTYKTSTVELFEDGRATYNDLTFTWKYLEETQQIIITSKDTNQSASFEIETVDGKQVIKFFQDVYYREQDFVAKDKEFLYGDGTTDNGVQDGNGTANTEETQVTEVTEISIPTESTASSTSGESNVPKEITITLENWNEYFEVYEWVDWQLNDFGEPTEFLGIRCSFNIKSEYADRCFATIDCEYIINQSHCDITYDVQEQTYTIINENDYFNESKSTMSGGAYESYIYFSIGDGGKASGSCRIVKYNFVEMTRMEGKIYLLEQ